MIEHLKRETSHGIISKIKLKDGHQVVLDDDFDIQLVKRGTNFERTTLVLLQNI